MFLPRPVTIFFSFAFVVFFLALGQRDFTLHQVIFPIQRGGYTGVALLIDTAEQFAEFTLIEQQFAGATGVGDVVGGHGSQWGDV